MLVLVCIFVGVVAGVVGIVLLVALFIPIQIGAGKYVQYIRRKVAGITDGRIRLYAYDLYLIFRPTIYRMSEILTAIKLVKLYGWEDSFVDRVCSSTSFSTL